MNQEGATHAGEKPLTPIRVLHVVSCLGRGGMEGGVMKLVTGCDPARVVADVCSLEPARAFQDLFGEKSHLHELKRRSAFDRRMIAAIARVIRERHVDIVHTHAWGTLLEGWIAAHLARAPHFIHGEHGTMELRALNVRLQRFLWNRADRLLAVSGELADRMTTRVGVRRDRIEVIPNGVDTERFGQIARQKARAALSLPPDAFIVVAIGRLVEVKNYPLLIDAARQLRDYGRDALFLVAGEGPLRSDMEQRISAAGLNDRVRLLGVRNDTPELLAAADAFVLTSWSEGMSNTILEAMAAGRPVIATRVGGNPELVVENTTGFLVRPDDPAELVHALGTLAGEPELTRDMGERARLRAEREFSLNRMIARYTAIYEGVATGRRANPAVNPQAVDKSLLIS